MPTLDWPSGFSVHGVPTRLNRHCRSTSSRSVSCFFAQSRIAATSFTVGLGLWAWTAAVATSSRKVSKQIRTAQRRAADLAMSWFLLVPACPCQLLSALGRRHLTADLAIRVGLGVNIDIPIARHHLLRLFGRQRCLTFDGTADGGALL